jgi:hypothetical protein
MIEGAETKFEIIRTIKHPTPAPSKSKKYSLCMFLERCLKANEMANPLKIKGTDKATYRKNKFRKPLNDFLITTGIPKTKK